jgi:hypothetical protein
MWIGSAGRGLSSPQIVAAVRWLMTALRPYAASAAVGAVSSLSSAPTTYTP